MEKQTAKNKKSLGCCSGMNNKLYFLVFGLIVIALTVWIFNSNQRIVKKGNSADQLAQDFNVELNIPQNNIGNLDDVPKEKIDSLFSNIKE
jgi:hypothetical protein